MDVIADFAAYPEWVDAVKRVDVVDPGTGVRARQVQFELDAGLFKDTYELVYDWSADGMSVTWELVSSKVQKRQQGSYQLRPLPDGQTEVTYSLTVELSIPLIGALRRKAEHTIMNSALGALARRAQPS